jgi:hypothetical protein
MLEWKVPAKSGWLVSSRLTRIKLQLLLPCRLVSVRLVSGCHVASDADAFRAGSARQDGSGNIARAGTFVTSPGNVRNPVIFLDPRHSCSGTFPLRQSVHCPERIPLRPPSPGFGSRPLAGTLSCFRRDKGYSMPALPIRHLDWVVLAELDDPGVIALP